MLDGDAVALDEGDGETNGAVQEETRKFDSRPTGGATHVAPPL